MCSICYTHFDDTDTVEGNCPVCEEACVEPLLTAGEIADVECPECNLKSFDLFEGFCGNCKHALFAEEHEAIAEEYGYVLHSESNLVRVITTEDDSYLCCGKLMIELDAPLMCPDCESPDEGNGVGDAMPTFYGAISSLSEVVYQLDVQGDLYVEVTQEGEECVTCDGCAYKSTPQCLSFLHWLKYLWAEGQPPGAIDRCPHFISEQEHFGLFGYGSTPEFQETSSIYNDLDDLDPIAQIIQEANDSDVERGVKDMWLYYDD